MDSENKITDIRTELVRQRKLHNPHLIKNLLFELVFEEQATFQEEQELYDILSEQKHRANFDLVVPSVKNIFTFAHIKKKGPGMRTYFLQLLEALKTKKPLDFEKYRQTLVDLVKDKDLHF